MPPRKQPLTAVAPLKTEAPTIPLHCLLCPKRPTFSDVSHLLTHISSKSHLSNRFKAEIRSSKERDARETLRQFDDWYDRYNIQELLADRMDAKDKKKAPKRSRDQSPDPKPRSYNKREKSIKAEPQPVSRQSTNGSLHAHSTRQDYGIDDSPYRTPVTRRSQRLLSAKGTSTRQVKSEPWTDDFEAPENSFQQEVHVEVPAVDDASDKSKLKGVFWPGMNLFDSATEEQKRKRNQRKDAAVLRNMEQVAAGVEPTECIWTGEIDLQRTRNIYATPSVYGSPEPEVAEDAEPKKKRARRSTAAAKTAPKRRKRASTRPARPTKKAIKQEEEEDEDSVLTSEPTDDSLETTPVDDMDSDQKAVSSSSTKSPEDTYDIFRDPPAAGSGHTDGSLNGMNFDLAARPALQPLSSNIAMNSPTMNSFKHLPHLRRGHSELSPSPGPFYSQPHHIGQNTFNNPLAFGRSQLNYTNQFAGNTTFGEDSKPLISGFQPINTMNGLPLNPYPMPTGGNSYYAASAPQEETNDLEA